MRMHRIHLLNRPVLLNLLSSPVAAFFLRSSCCLPSSLPHLVSHLSSSFRHSFYHFHIFLTPQALFVKDLTFIGDGLPTKYEADPTLFCLNKISQSGKLLGKIEAAQRMRYALQPQPFIQGNRHISISSLLFPCSFSDFLTNIHYEDPDEIEKLSKRNEPSIAT